MKEMQKVAKKAVKSHEDRMHKGVKKMAKGGVTSDMRKSHGRNMAKIANQGGK